MKIYLSGSMSAHKEDFNYPLFDEWTAKLRAAGHTVWSPVEEDRKRQTNRTDAMPGGNLRREVMRADLHYILTEADAVYVLPNSYRISSGCRAEVAAAKSLPIPVKFLRRNGVHKSAK
jgi:hypothetical protein